MVKIIANVPIISSPKRALCRKKKRSILKKKISVSAKRQRIRTRRAITGTRKKRQIYRLFGFRCWPSSNNVIRNYLEYGGRLPKVDNFNKMKSGCLVKVLQTIEGRTVKPRKRIGIKTYRYLVKIYQELPKDTHLMFLERHSSFPEWYKFIVIGGRTIWIDISEFIDFLSIMRKPVSKKKEAC